MSQTLNIPDHHGSTLTREETEWPAFNDRQEYCGQIYLIAAWAVPKVIYEELELPSHIDLYITSKGHWASTPEHAEHYLSTTETPTEFLMRGATLCLFVPGEWAADNGSPNTYSDYRVYQRSPGFWDAEEVEEAPLVLVGAANYF
jgi:hypothetical protein